MLISQRLRFGIGLLGRCRSRPSSITSNKEKQARRIAVWYSIRSVVIMTFSTMVCSIILNLIMRVSLVEMPLRHYPASRLRRTRSRIFLRRLVREHVLRVDDLICPLFVLDGCKRREAVPSMPGVERLSIDLLRQELEVLATLGIAAVALFPVPEATVRTSDAEAAWDEEGLVQRAIRSCKSAVPELGVVTDIALDPYTSHGQDGLVSENGQVLNDETVAALVKQGLSHARAGSDVLAPSDMMDGRVGALRTALEQQGFHDTSILAYSAKYASAFYNPFRVAVGTGERLGGAEKASYQMDPANINEAMAEVAMDIEEGADIVMIKPGLPCLDVIRCVKQHFRVPTFAYQVSGEYAMLRAAAERGWLDERATVLESLLSCKRAGADAVFSYYAKQVAAWLAV